jgi:hypothetical protein
MSAGYARGQAAFPENLPQWQPSDLAETPVTCA